MNQEFALTIHPIFTALTRPPMLFGVTLDYVCICVLAVLCSFILLNSPLYLLLYIPLHVLGWVVCQFDPNGFRILAKKTLTPRIRNVSIWRCQRYDVI